jgi:hypothetical protein
MSRVIGRRPVVRLDLCALVSGGIERRSIRWGIFRYERYSCAFSHKFSILKRLTTLPSDVEIEAVRRQDFLLGQQVGGPDAGSRQRNPRLQFRRSKAPLAEGRCTWPHSLPGSISPQCHEMAILNREVAVCPRPLHGGRGDVEHGAD